VKIEASEKVYSKNILSNVGNYCALGIEL